MKQVILLCSTLLLLLNSCDYTTGSGNIVSEKRTVDDFTGISVSNAIEVEIKIGLVTEVRVEADDNIIKHIVTGVSDGELSIKLKGLHNFGDAHLKVYITTPDLQTITASSSADVKVLDIVKSNKKLRFKASSSADIDAEVDAPDVEAEASSSASVTLRGRTKNYTAEASSSGDIKSAELLCENADVNANSSGSAAVNASVSLNAKATSSGSIDYYGEAAVKETVNSSGSVEKK
ncbi:head GIN domain-containing protein [Ferruginibacter profundus]